MIYPPFMLRLLVDTAGHRRISLWIPLVLIWLPALLIALALAPVVLLIGAIGWKRGWGKRLIQGGPLLYHLCSALRGLRVQVKQNPNTHVFISMW